MLNYLFFFFLKKVKKRTIKFVNIGDHLLLLLSGGYDKEEKAARAYDLAALKYWGTTTTTNFPVSCHFLILFCHFFSFFFPVYVH